MAAKHWPGDVLKPAAVLFYPDAPSASAGPSFSGAEQVVFSSSGRWHAKMTMLVRLARVPVVMSRERVLSARAIVAYLKGRSNTIYIGPFDGYNAPSPVAGGVKGFVKTKHSDGTGFSDGSSYRQYASPAVLTGTVAAGVLACSISLLNSAQSVNAGQYFGLGDSELYLIDSVVNAGGGVFNVTFWPTLRSNHAASEVVNFDDPTCEMRLAADASAQLNFAPGFVADQEIEMVEAL